MPGDGLEPARILPDPRDFKSATISSCQQLISNEALYQREFSIGYPAFLLLSLQCFRYSDSPILSWTPIEAFCQYANLELRFFGMVLYGAFLQRTSFSGLSFGSLPRWVVNLIIFYQDGVQSRLATFMLDQIWLSPSQATEAGLATAKHWIDTGKP